MENPAQLLYQRLLEWQTTPLNMSDLEFRGGDNGDWWSAHAEAVRWLDAVSARVEAMAASGTPLHSGQDMLRRLREGVFVVGAVMNASPSNARHRFQDGDLMNLQLLAGLWPVNEPMISADSAQGLLDVVRDAQDLLTDATGLSNDEIRYLHELLRSLNNALLSISTLGSADIRRLTNELIGALGMLFSDADEKHSKKAHDLMNRAARYGKHLFAVAVGGAVESGVDQMINQITS